MFARVVTLMVGVEGVVTWFDVIAPGRKSLAPVAVKVPHVLRMTTVIVNTWSAVLTLLSGVGGRQCA